MKKKILGITVAGVVAMSFTGCGTGYENAFLETKVSGPYKAELKSIEVIHEEEALVKGKKTVNMSLQTTFKNTQNEYLCSWKEVMSSYTGTTKTEEACLKKKVRIGYSTSTVKGTVLAKPNEEFKMDKDIKFTVSEYKKWEAKS